MDRSLIKSMMPSLVAGHVPRNVRSFKYRVFDDQPLSSTLGFAIDPQPFDGKVVAATDDAIVVKLKPSEFAVLDPSLVTTVPAEGAKVHVQPYARRRFDGLRADTPEVITEETSDGTPYTITRHILGSAPAPVGTDAFSSEDAEVVWRALFTLQRRTSKLALDAFLKTDNGENLSAHLFERNLF